jgi:hypothetical protein
MLVPRTELEEFRYGVAHLRTTGLDLRFRH